MYQQRYYIKSWNITKRASKTDLDKFIRKYSQTSLKDWYALRWSKTNFTVNWHHFDINCRWLETDSQRQNLGATLLVTGWCSFLAIIIRYTRILISVNKNVKGELFFIYFRPSVMNDFSTCNLVYLVFQSQFCFTKGINHRLNSSNVFLITWSA